MATLTNEVILRARLRLYIHEECGDQLADILAIFLAGKSTDDIETIGSGISLAMRSFARRFSSNDNVVAERQKYLFKTYAAGIVDIIMQPGIDRARLLRWVNDLKRDMG